jgi:hypothetical protein
MRLSVQVDTEVVALSYFAIWKKPIPVAEILPSEAPTYRPILEYDGWRIWYSLFGKGRAYNVRATRAYNWNWRTTRAF